MSESSRARVRFEHPGAQRSAANASDRAGQSGRLAENWRANRWRTGIAHRAAPDAAAANAVSHRGATALAGYLDRGSSKPATATACHYRSTLLESQKLLNSAVRVAADVGGTFTDVLVAIPGSNLLARKVSSTTGSYAKAILHALEDLHSAGELNLAKIDEVLHGTTVATNTILEHKGARVVLLTTLGFRDVLDIGRLRMPVLYNITYEKPPVLVPRHMRLEVNERIDADGSIHRELTRKHMTALIDDIICRGAEGVAICLINSHVNSAHERLLKKAFQEVSPSIFLSVSSDILPEIGEYERTSTTVINAYLGPAVGSYLKELKSFLRHAGVRAPVRIMQSNGGMLPAGAAAEKPVYIVESGPAAGVIGAQALARTVGLGNLISFDMGGTTAKASVIENGQMTWANEFVVGGPISVGARLMRGGGYSISLPAIDIAEVGAGGGSIIRVDSGGSLQVGPESAGAVPGPVAYDSGGARPTLTDANILLGYINPSFVAGGAVRLNANKAAKVFYDSVAVPMKLSAVEAAFGAFMVANSSMIRAINAVSVERGRDPRQFALLAFGGSGPIHAAAMASELGIGRVIVPPLPGLFSAYGLLVAQTEYHMSRTMVRLLSSDIAEEVESGFTELETEVLAQVRHVDKLSEVKLHRLADIRYYGQSYSLTVAAPRPLHASSLPEVRGAFEKEYLRTYGYWAPGQPVEITTLRVRIILPSMHTELPKASRAGSECQPERTVRKAYFGESKGWQQTPMVSQRALAAGKRRGPLIVEEYDATTVVPPGWTVRLDRHLNLVLEASQGV